MKVKLKVCAGFDGNEHEAYIYKNIDGKKYCKSCTYKLNPPKSINKISEKHKFKLILKKELLEEDKKFYLEVWYNKFGRVEGTAEKYGNEVDNTIIIPYCLNCRKRLFYEPNLCYFHHILEKRNYPQYRHEKSNIAIICEDCHNKYETMPDMVPFLVDLREELLKYNEFKSE